MPDQPFRLRENPFADGHDGRYIYPAGRRVEVVALLRKRIADGESFVTITGESGCGKTSAVTEVLEDETLGARVAFLAHPSLTPSELLEAVCIEFGAPLPNPPSKPQALASLVQHLRELRKQGWAPVLVLDEAHGLKTEPLEEVRLLSNLKSEGGRSLVQTILVGLPELERRLGLPELAQLRQRIAVHARMAPLTVEETEGYLHHRVGAAGGDGPAVFTAEACREVHNYTNGVPRDINTLAGRALECAERDGADAVYLDHVRMAAGDSRPHGIATAARTADAAQPFELRRRVSPSRPVPQVARVSEPPVDRP
ncbi:MAG: ExeA family protein, partial [Candidatus Eiseniibacteriota bacterium]